jgi:hypothetical protein
VSTLPARLWPRIALTLGGVLASAWLAAAPLDSVRECGVTASPEVTGIKDLSAKCPDLMDALRSLGLDAMLYDGWQQKLNGDAVRDLGKLAERYAGPKPQGSADVAALPGILKTLAREQTPLPKSWWDAFGAWLRSWLARGNSNSLSWLDHWLERIGHSITSFNVISYSLVALVLIAAAAIVITELKTAGLVRKRRDLEASGTRAMDPAIDARVARAAEPIAPAHALSILLHSLVDRLTQTGRLKGARSMTHRELIVRSNFEAESHRTVFADVAGAAEIQLYGSESSAPQHVSRVLEEGQSLLTQLSDSSSGR